MNHSILVPVVCIFLDYSCLYLSCYEKEAPGHEPWDRSTLAVGSKSQYRADSVLSVASVTYWRSWSTTPEDKGARVSPWASAFKAPTSLKKLEFSAWGTGWGAHSFPSSCFIYPAFLLSSGVSLPLSVPFYRLSTMYTKFTSHSSNAWCGFSLSPVLQKT